MIGIITEYMNYLEDLCGFAKRTLKIHKRICGIWKEYLGQKGRDILNVLPDDLLDYIEFREKQVKRSTLSGELCVLRTLYAYLHDFGKMSSNPAASLPELICEPPAESSWLTVDECFRFLEGFEMSDPIGLRNYTITALLWSTGLRNSELCALNWRDIDLEEGSLLVRKGKGGKQRQIFFNDRVRDDLIRYQSRRSGDPGDPVFFAFPGKASGKPKHSRLSQSRLVDIIREHGKTMELKKPVKPLVFRHTFATHMHAAGVPVQAIKEMMGHDAETETTIYIHISIDLAKQFLEDHIANPEKYT